jgi:indolepyruvate ferredoxin oxidoreductase beta subunit
MIISGVGGQGVLLVTRIVSDYVLREGHPVIGSEDHGMSQRGGSVITYLKIGDFNSPLVKRGSADILLSLERNEALKTLHYLRPSSKGQDGGLGFINASDPNYMNEPIRNYLRDSGIEIHIFSADRIAMEMGSVQSTNIALMGFASAHPKFPFTSEKLRESIGRVTPPRFRELSLTIFDRGVSEGHQLIKS